MTTASPANDAVRQPISRSDRRTDVADLADGSRETTATLARAELGMYVFLASDLMLFAPFFAAYFLLRTNAAEWPPGDVSLDVARAAVATLVLVASSITLIAGDRAADAGDLVRMRRWVIVTVGLGAAFLVNQIVEYSTLSFGPGDHTYGSIYWLLTGLHGAHVSIGLLCLTALFIRTFRVADAEQLSTWTAGASAFWHLIDVVWIGVFTTIWVIR